MTSSRSVNIIEQRRNEFINKMGAAVEEIKEKFATFHTQLFSKEASLIQLVENIQKNALDKFDNEIAPKLAEINQARGCLINIITSNSNQQFLDKQINNCDSEIDTIIGKSGIQRILEIKWKVEGLNIGNISQITPHIIVSASMQEAIVRETSEGIHRNDRFESNRANETVRRRFSLRSPSPYYNARREIPTYNVDGNSDSILHNLTSSSIDSALSSMRSGLS